MVAGEPWGYFIRGWPKAVEGLRMRAEREIRWVPAMRGCPKLSFLL